MSTNFFQILENGNDSTSLYINDNNVLNKIVGVEDSFLKILEDLSGTQINLRGNLITIKGENSKSKNVINAINQMLKKTDKKILEEEDVKSIYYFESEKTLETSDDVIIKTPKKNIFARTEKQKKYIKNLQTSNIIFSLGPAGTGKTYTGVAMAVKALKEKEIKKIILTRPAVEAGENLGYLPGDLKEKLDPYMQPLYDALRDMIPSNKLQKFLEDRTIEIAPLAFMRGRTLDNAFVILDEAQNTTNAQMKMFLTRMGMNAKFMVTGDPGQIDLPRKVSSGLKDAIKILSRKKGIDIIYLDDRDVIRHPIVKKVIDAYNKIEK